MNNLEIAKAVLEAANTELHIDEIAKRAISSGLTQGVAQEDLSKKIGQSLSLATKRKTSPFSKVKNAQGGTKRGVYRLKRVINKQPELPIPEPEQTEETGFVGRGGEYAVMSELLFLGFNVSLMTVDKGVDIVAANDNGKYFHIQVKTSKTKEGNFQAAIKKKSFESADSGQTFYVFVLRRDSKNDFIILPSSQIAIYIGGGLVKGSDSYSLRFSYDTKTRKYTLNGSQDMALFTNKWAMIR